jgi:hypothetical protein
LFLSTVGYGPEAMNINGPTSGKTNKTFLLSSGFPQVLLSLFFGLATLCTGFWDYILFKYHYFGNVGLTCSLNLMGIQLVL